MLKLFLKSLIKGKSKTHHPEWSIIPAPSGRNQDKRSFERYAVNHKHLALMNEQDILLIRDISAKGFATEVAPRAASRFKLGDIYEARMRYVGEVFELEAKVAWKSGNMVGFEMIRAPQATMLFMKRLIDPMKRAASLEAVESGQINEGGRIKQWFHGDQGTDLWVWRDGNDIAAWQLHLDRIYIQWDSQHGLSTGVMREEASQKTGTSSYMHASSTQLLADNGPDGEKVRIATDVFMSVRFDIRERLLATLSV